MDSRHLKDLAFWKRTLYMILFAIAYSIAELIIVVVVLVQFLTILLTGRANETLLRFGNSLSQYVRKVFRFLMYNSEEMPFPFSDWPEEPAEGDRWRADPRPRTDPPVRGEDAPAAGTAPLDDDRGG